MLQSKSMTSYSKPPPSDPNFTGASIGTIVWQRNNVVVCINLHTGLLCHSLFFILPPYYFRDRKKTMFVKASFADPNKDPEVIHALQQREKSQEVVQPTLKFNRSCCVCAPTRSLPHRNSTPYTKTSPVKPSSCTKSGFDF